MHIVIESGYRETITADGSIVPNKNEDNHFKIERYTLSKKYAAHSKINGYWIFKTSSKPRSTLKQDDEEDKKKSILFN